jgi:hypothetical protein
MADQKKSSFNSFPTRFPLLARTCQENHPESSKADLYETLHRILQFLDIDRKIVDLSNSHSPTLFLLHVNPTSEGRARSSTNIKNRSQP